jgi:hypothetical protein
MLKYIFVLYLLKLEKLHISSQKTLFGGGEGGGGG